MSKLLIAEYHQEIDELIRYGGSRNESALESAFQKLLAGYCRPREIKLVPKVEVLTKSGAKVYPDGTVKTALRQDSGYWGRRTAATISTRKSRRSSPRVVRADNEVALRTVMDMLLAKKRANDRKNCLEEKGDKAEV